MKRKIFIFLKVFGVFSLLAAGMGYYIGGLLGVILFVAIEFAGVFTAALMVKLASYRYIDSKRK